MRESVSETPFFKAINTIFCGFRSQIHYILWF